MLLAIGQGPELGWLARGAEGVSATERAPGGRRGHVRDGSAGRLRDRRRAHGRGHGRGGRGRGSARGLRRRRLPPGPGPRRDPDAPDAGRAAAGVPLDRALHRRGQGAAHPPQGDAGRGAQPQLHRVRDPLHAAGGDDRVGTLPPVHLRGDRLLRPAPPGHRVRHHAQDARADADRALRSAASRRTASPATTTTTSATTATPSSCASPRAASTAGAARTCARRSSARPATTSCAPASTRSSRRRWT